MVAHSTPPVQHTTHYWPPLDQGFAVSRTTRAHANPWSNGSIKIAGYRIRRRLGEPGALRAAYRPVMVDFSGNEYAVFAAYDGDTRDAVRAKVAQFNRITWTEMD